MRAPGSYPCDRVEERVPRSDGPTTTIYKELDYGARFEDDTLVVITTDVDFAWFDQTGIPQSEALRLVERFEVIEDGRYLNYSVTATDPAVFTEPVLLEKRWVWLPGDEIKPYECSYDRRDL